MQNTEPLQNRATPRGDIVSTPERGLFMGNRGGRLHDEHQKLGRARWKSKAWIICKLSFRGRDRKVMGDGYTELFFLDEATALAAGHRPCFECRRAGAVRFAQLWSVETSGRASAPQMDTALHAARTGKPVVGLARDLPQGAMILHDDQPALICDGSMRRWSHSGYGSLVSLPLNRVPVLTPAPTIEVLRAGYLPVQHPSAGTAQISETGVGG